MGAKMLFKRFEDIRKMKFRRLDAHLVALKGGVLYLNRNWMRTHACASVADAPHPPVRIDKADVTVEAQNRFGLRKRRL